MAEVGEPDRVVVDRVDRDQHVDELLGAAARVVVRQRGDVGAGAQDAPVDELHDVEGRVVDRDVVAEPERLRDRHRGRCERGEHLVLAGHVVRGRQHVPERRAAQHPLVCAVADRVGEVRAAARDERRGELAAGRAVDVRGEPRAQAFEVDAGRRVGHGREVTEPTSRRARVAGA